MKHVTNLIRTTVLTLAIIVAAVAVPTASQALDLSVKGGVDSARGNDQPANLFGNAGIFSTITNTLLFILGAISVIMIIVGGLRYVISGGDSAAVSAAKNTILYAIVGVIVAILAYAIINFVIGSFTGAPSSSGVSSGV